MNLKNIYNSLETLKQGSRSVFYDSLKTALKSCLVLEFTQGNERPCQEEDFSDFRKENESNLFYLKLIFEDLIRCEYFKQHAPHLKQIKNLSKDSYVPGIDDEILALIFIVCGENVVMSPWNTTCTVENAYDIIGMVLKLYKCKNMPEILVSRSLFKDILINLRPRLLPATWKHYPASVVCYQWIIKYVEQPHLSPFLHLVLPTALILVDDFVTDNRIIGISCLHHVIDNVTIAELKYYGHGDVIYNALESLLRSRESEIVKIALPCIICLVSKLETNFGEKEVKWSKFDDVLSIYLENMELEHLIILREIYIQNLPHLIKSSGLRIIRWSRKLLKIFKEYLEVACNHSDVETMNYCLRGLEIYLQNSQPVMSLYSNFILFMLLKTLYSLLNMTESTIQKRNKELIIQCSSVIFDQFPLEEKEKLKRDLFEKMGDLNHSKFFTVLSSLIC
ncbi:UNVERIFIED_CONTAM: hypothetical protein PYX00_008790 [Menopon gallinae]|uniref:TELO2-interacting protein 2 n=2 Tax=Menopon gallinae TaxID=328185 RepID=A0AAW2HPA3_9NEOP